MKAPRRPSPVPCVPGYVEKEHGRLPASAPGGPRSRGRLPCLCRGRGPRSRSGHHPLGRAHADPVGPSGVEGAGAPAAGRAGADQDAPAFKFNPNLSFDDYDIVSRKLSIHKILNSLNKEQSIAKKFDLIAESVVKYFDAAFARIWILDDDQKYLILKCSAGIYTDCQGEFSKVSVYSGKIGHVLRTKKPAISNDLSNDPRIKYPEWAKKTNLKSFAGFPLIYQNKSIGVLAMFSEKRLKPVDFELIEIFCHDVSKQLSIFLEGQKFLFNNER